MWLDIFEICFGNIFCSRVRVVSKTKENVIWSFFYFFILFLLSCTCLQWITSKRLAWKSLSQHSNIWLMASLSEIILSLPFWSFSNHEMEKLLKKAEVAFVNTSFSGLPSMKIIKFHLVWKFPRLSIWIVIKYDDFLYK